MKDWRTGFSTQSVNGGYVALDHTRQRIIVAFRGTINPAGWVANFAFSPQEYTRFPGSEDQSSGRTVAGKTEKHDATAPRCENCTVHSGFHRAWNNTRSIIAEAVGQQVARYPHYELHLLGHSLGAAVAAFAALDFQARRWEPTITTFGEPRIGNAATNKYIDDIFALNQNGSSDHLLRWRRVTHTNDPIPLLPPTEWGFGMHAGEIHITKPSLSPGVHDLKHCRGPFDASCIAGQDPTYPDKLGTAMLEDEGIWTTLRKSVPQLLMRVVKRDVPQRYRISQMFIAHRDYFWRLGLCVPGGDPTGGGGDFHGLEAWREENGVRDGEGSVIGKQETEVEKEEL